MSSGAASLINVTDTATYYVNDALDHFRRLPGSSIVLRYIHSSYQNDPIRSAVELFFFLFAVYYLLSPAYSTTKKTHVPLTDEVCNSVANQYVQADLEQEIDDLVDEWTPEPLAVAPTAFEAADNEKRPVIVGPSAPKSKLANGRTVTNLATYNHFNFINNDALKDHAVKTLRTYGVGPCGPPGFYGTQDVHSQLEADVASHLGAVASIIYAQSFSTISSVIPAFAKRGDIIVADKAVNFAIRKGLQISRSTIKWYKHNDMADLERVLSNVVTEHIRTKKPLTRRFIVTEGLFENVGDMVPLPEVLALKQKYKFRMILDETWSYGVVGRTGRGVTEHFKTDAKQVDMIIGSLAGALCGGGGFCAGTEEVVEHQRLSGNAYTFSAALPALLATTASETITLLQEQPEHIRDLREHSRIMRAQLDPRSDWITCVGAMENPILLLAIKDDVIASRRLSVEDQEWLIQDIVDECLVNGVLITRLKAMPAGLGSTPRDQDWQPKPALKVCVTTGLTRKETERAGIAIRHAVTKIMTRKAKA